MVAIRKDRGPPWVSQPKNHHLLFSIFPNPSGPVRKNGKKESNKLDLHRAKQILDYVPEQNKLLPVESARSRAFSSSSALRGFRPPQPAERSEVPSSRFHVGRLWRPGPEQHRWMEENV